MWDTQFSNDSIRVNRTRDYDALFNNIIENFLVNFNEDIANGYDMGKLDDHINFMRGMIVKTKVSPFLIDGFIYGGFNYFIDAPTIV